MNTISEDYHESMQALLQEAMNEVAMEEALATEQSFSKQEFNGLGGHEDQNNFYIEQDIQAILDDAKLERDMRQDGLITPEAGTRKFATIPMAAIIDYFNRTGVDIMDAETSQSKEEMAKFRMWIQTTHPEFMVRERGKSKYHTMT